MLTSRDLRRLLDCLDEIYATRRLDAFPSRVIACLSALVPADGISYNEMNVRRRRCVLVSNRPDLTPETVSAFEKHVAEHPLVAHYRRTGDGRARKIWTS